MHTDASQEAWQTMKELKVTIFSTRYGQISNTHNYIINIFLGVCEIILLQVGMILDIMFLAFPRCMGYGCVWSNRNLRLLVDVVS